MKRSFEPTPEDRRDALAREYSGMAFHVISASVARRGKQNWQTADFEDWANMAYAMADAMEAARKLAREA